MRVQFFQLNLASVADGVVDVSIISAAQWADRDVNALPGDCIDDEMVLCSASAVDPSRLRLTRYSNQEELAKLIADDLASVADGIVDVRIVSAAQWADRVVKAFPGDCIDDEMVLCSASAVDPSLLRKLDGEVELEELHSHLLYSNCPVTNQPDLGSILIRYSGTKIDRGGLLQYLVSYRQHNGFHEACVENIFFDVMSRCAPSKRPGLPVQRHGRF